MTNEQTNTILNDVLETLIDSTDGYEKAAEVADRPAFKQLFGRRAASRRAMAADVRNHIVELGGTPDDDGSILANMHRTFLSIRAAVQDNDNAAIEAVDNGEKHLREQFEDALENDDLSPSARALLKKYQGELRADGRLIDQLEDAA
ncbi:MAG: PA2169 family four-helix-bundle protein [Parasphingorhabdus sp.]|uniref:ferritin-like domain-containing protein n=1 Tax=Parasphingorhabdus sp. TaxID=2709688 RepID=UPI003001E1D6